jgi:hypothetical protein
MEACREEDFANVCISRGIGPSYSTSSVQAYVDAGLQRYVIPFLRYVERELRRADDAYMPTRIAERKFDDVVLGRAFTARFPRTHEHLKRISAEFLRSDADAIWQNVGNSCRQAMLEFCAECSAMLQLKLPDNTKRGDVKTIVRELVRKIYGGSLSACSCTWDPTPP